MNLIEGVLPNKRNTTIDLLRGFYLFVILIDHLSYKFYPSPFKFVNGYGNLWVSAAEGFIFISGLLVGIIYARKTIEKGIKTATKLLLSRSLKLFLIHTALTILFTVLALYIGTWPEVGQGVMYAPFRTILKNTLTLRYNYGWADVLILYAIFIAISPVFFYFKNRRLVFIPLLVSMLLWLYSYKTENVYNSSLSSFEILSWQFLFYIGVVAGIFKEKILKLYNKHKKVLKIAIIILFVVSYTISCLEYYFDYYPLFSVQTVDVLFVKATLGPGRLLTFFVWFSFYYLVFDKLKGFFTQQLGWLFLTYGENSLFTYVAQSILLFFAYYLGSTENIFINLVTSMVGILAVVLIVKLWITRKIPKLPQVSSTL